MVQHSSLFCRRDIDEEKKVFIKSCPLRQIFNSQHLQFLDQGSLTERGRLSTVDLLVLISSDWPVLILKTLFTFFYKTSYLNEETICTMPSPSVSVPWRWCASSVKLDGVEVAMTLSTISVVMLSVVILNVAAPGVSKWSLVDQYWFFWRLWLPLVWERARHHSVFTQTALSANDS